MRFPREGLLSQFGQPFNDTVRPALPTIAQPAWFAPPIDVRQGDGAMTIVFKVTGHVKELRVEALGRNIFVWGTDLYRSEKQGAGQRAMRVFAVPFEVSTHDLETWRAGDLLCVRIAKNKDRLSRFTVDNRHITSTSTSKTDHDRKEDCHDDSLW